jgi:FdrA protein
MIRSTHILRSSYYDSVVLMRVASQLKKRDNVSEVAMFMGTEGNHDLLAQVGLTTRESLDAGPQDLIIIVEADSEELSSIIAEEAVMMLKARIGVTETNLNYRPRTLDRALGFLPDATLAAISIPGEYAAREALKCTNKGLNVFLFSDNVSIEDELALKKNALEKNLLFMGPDCGTAYINGTALGFANVIKPGRIGCIAASGTGLQAVVSELDRLGQGVSHGIGVGGRDLSVEIGGLMTAYSLELLDKDQGTDIIILLSKQPHPSVVEALESICAKMSTPVVACFQGAKIPGDTFTQAATLDEAAARTVSMLNGTPFVSSWFEDTERVVEFISAAETVATGKRVVGLFTGGTLAKEAHIILAAELGAIATSLDEHSAHILVDLGDDQYTVGRPHPMIAPESRTEILLELAEEGNLKTCGVLLVDLVLGNGSHLDPAEELVESIEMLRRQYVFSAEVVAVVIGTEEDPQNLPDQIKKLEDSGVRVFRSNSEAARYTAMLVAPDCRERYLKEVE